MAEDVAAALCDLPPVEWRALVARGHRRHGVGLRSEV